VARLAQSGEGGEAVVLGNFLSKQREEWGGVGAWLVVHYGEGFRPASAWGSREGDTPWHERQRGLGERHVQRGVRYGEDDLVHWPTRGRRKMGMAQEEQCLFRYNSNFQTYLNYSIKRWPSRARKNPNKIWICRELNKEQLYLLKLSKFRIEFELKIKKALGFEIQ
jgi:hypothetical protein